MTALTQPPPELFVLEQPIEQHPQPSRRRAAIKAVDQAAPPRDDVTTSLVEAVDKVFRVVTARIAYHEAEARRLREALKPFAGFPSASPDVTGGGDLLQQVLDIAKKLPLEDS